jgi:hypothetical protein
MNIHVNYGECSFEFNPYNLISKFKKSLNHAAADAADYGLRAVRTAVLLY